MCDGGKPMVDGGLMMVDGDGDGMGRYGYGDWGLRWYGMAAGRQAGGRGRDCVLDLKWCGREGAVREASARS